MRAYCYRTRGGRTVRAATQESGGTTYEIKPVKISAAIILSVDISARKFADNVAGKIFGATFSIGKFVTERFFWYNSAKLRAEMGNLSDFFLQILI